ncbi:MFS transporter [Ureibacillus chungkukjangi]|uniref:DHA1 family multidrug resistance protein-like MFS transporter n=1 Tax=Ureibacillus chungkukjangi TaxID=1202712 RepID=A0A318TWV2_9BACL|nr:MFS transporter [Ureibacillus chungkukjangi]PYF06475.1 DHA1 family multidrug resistance protein-like MFS transporter [Ureibacillus chungkukjangi]
MSQKKKKLALSILMLNMFITMGGVGIVIPVLPTYLQIFGVGGEVYGTLIAIFAFAQFLFSPLAGGLSDRYGRKLFIIGGLIVYGISQIIFGLATDVWVLYLGRFLSGFGAAFIMTTVMAYVADITTIEERGKGMGLIGAAISLGFMIGPGLGGFLATVNIHFPFFLAGGVSLIAALLSFIVLPNVKPHLNEATKHVPREKLLKQLVRSVKTPYFVILIVVFTFNFGISNFQSTLSMFLTYKFDYTATYIAIVITVGGFAGVVLQMFIIDKLFRRFGEMKVILVNLLVAAITMVLMIFVSGFFVILTIATLFQVAGVFIRPAVNTLISKFAGNEQGYAAGMNNAYMSLGNMIGPALAGVLLEWHLSIPFAFGAVILLGCFGLALGWTQKKAPHLMHPTVEGK